MSIVVDIDKAYYVTQKIEYYRNRGSHVFVCYMDFSEAFDKLNYWKLFKQLLDDGMLVT